MRCEVSSSEVFSSEVFSSECPLVRPVFSSVVSFSEVYQ